MPWESSAVLLSAKFERKAMVATSVDESGWTPLPLKGMAESYFFRTYIHVCHRL